MSKLVLTKRNLKRRFPRIALAYSNTRFLRDFQRTLRLLRNVEMCLLSSTVPGNGKKVVINSVRTYHPFQFMVEAMLAMKLASRGYEVKLLCDDKVMVHHDILTLPDHDPFQAYYRFPMKLSQSMISRLPLVSSMMQSYSDLVSADDLKEVEASVSGDVVQFENVELAPFVEASLVRFFLSAPDRHLLESEAEYPRANRMFVKNCLLGIVAARNVWQRERPDILISSHGIYSTWGPFRQYMADRGVRCITYGASGYATNALDWGVNSIAANKSDNGYFEHLLGCLSAGDLDREEVVRQVDRFMQMRFEGSAGDIARLGGRSDGDETGVLERVDRLREEGRRIFGLFPNVMWDNATTFKEWNRVFDSPVEWLVETVRQFMGIEDKALVIRVHPAEHTWMPVRKSVVDILRFYLGDEIARHKNLIIIPPENRLSSYRLFDRLSAGIVYNGTIGPELIYKGVPVIIAAKAAYSDKGFTYDFKTRNGYFESFDRTDDIREVQNHNSDLIRLFLYEYFFLHGVPMKFLSEKVLFEPHWEGDVQSMWEDENLNRVIDVITGERRFFQELSAMPAGG